LGATAQSSTKAATAKTTKERHYAQSYDNDR